MVAKTKRYLSQDLISRMIIEAKNPIWKKGIVVGIGSNWYDIVAVSPLNIIHFHGNTDTGWEHINNRHNFYSNALYFGTGKEGNPSKFSYTAMPIKDYLHIADDVFSTGTIDTSPHSDGVHFVKYVGKSSRYAGYNGVAKDFVLILYRGTKIVHSIYPKNNVDGKAPKRILENFSRAKHLLKANMKLVGETLVIHIPYVNTELIPRYVILLVVDWDTQTGKVYLQANAPNGEGFFCTLARGSFKVRITRTDATTDSLEFTRFLNGLAYFDFRSIEEDMLYIEENIFTSK